MYFTKNYTLHIKSKHIDYIIRKALKLLGFITRFTKIINNSFILIYLFKSVVGPSVEFLLRFGLHLIIL